MKKLLFISIFLTIVFSIKAQSSDTWQATSTVYAPIGRIMFTAVWTGTEMIVWGGRDSNYIIQNTGGRYNPITDTWIATSTVNAPDARCRHTAIWTGTEMIIWGDEFSGINTGGRYNPSTDTWQATSLINAPSIRRFHSAVWTGTEMIIWGGGNSSSNIYFNSGSKYNPILDTWQATSLTNAPIARSGHTAIWTGTEMIVWGGVSFSGSFSYLNSGGRYNPITNTWVATNLTNAPSPRDEYTAVWTGTEMIVWGGYNFNILNSGGKYNPTTDTWIATSITNAPVSRANHTAVWTGTEMIVWGGSGSGYICNTGGIFNPISNSWTSTTTFNAPVSRYSHTAVWTGSQMIIWGGDDGSNSTNTGGRYTTYNCNVVPTIAIATPALFCNTNTTTTTLGIIGGNLDTISNWNWYSAGCGTTYIASGNSLTQTPTITTTYWVRAEGASSTTSCVSVTVIVSSDSYPASHTLAFPLALCPGSSSSIFAIGGSISSDANWNWYSGSCGGAFISSSPTVLNVSPTITTTYYVRAEGACNTTNCLSRTITANCLSLPPISASGTSPVCSEAISTLSVNGGTLGTGAHWEWYKSSCGGVLVGTGAVISQLITSPAIYYVRAVGICNNTYCVSKTVVLSAPSIIPASILALSPTVNLGSPAIMILFGGVPGTGAHWSWYSGSCGGVFTGTGFSISTFPTVTTTYYVRGAGQTHIKFSRYF